MKRLVLSLKKKWFDLIKNGVKLEEYREIKPYWKKRFGLGDVNFVPYDEVEFTLGYPPKGDTERRIVFKNPSIRISSGKQEWGAEKRKLYFVITWEK